ncbi:MAG: ABC transporter ATP-binding protein [Bacteroidota bacterium]|nr:ABC transporter ATP-binding protein [Bacteroidota bacterium]
MNILEVVDLSIRFQNKYQTHEVVKNIHFNVKRNQTLGIVGESGSGKSVTALSIMKLLGTNASYPNGQIFYNDGQNSVDLLKLSEKEIRPYRGAKIGLIFQEPMSALNPVLKCGYQLTEALLAHQKCSISESRSRAEYWFEKVGLSHASRMFDSYPHQLSGGQLQRILIAMALCCDPKLVIADEPTTALDVTIQRNIINLLAELKSELGLSMIFISHDLGLVHEICDQVAVMQDGRIVEQGACDEIFNTPSHPYTKGLIFCKPPLKRKVRRLLTVQDYIENKVPNNYFDDTYTIHPHEMDRKIDVLHQAKPLLSIQNVHVNYIKQRNFWGQPKEVHHAVNNISFDIFPGEIVGLVGESGSGKSSLGKAILKLIPNASGKVLYKDNDILSMDGEDLRVLRKDLQIIFQDPYSSLNPRKSAGEALIEPMLVHKLHANSKTRKEVAIKLLEDVGLQADHFHRFPHQFSGGQRQRVCIARALSLEPKFIVCDESVSALDVSVQAQVLNLLMDLKEKYTLSYLFISHDLSVVHFISDRILVMKEGEIVEEGKSYEIINTPKTQYTQRLIEAIPK